MSKISCTLRLGEVPLHLYQIIAGFMLLAKQGTIELKIEKLKKSTPNETLPYNIMEVIINNDVRVFYDLNDGYDNLLSEGQSYIDFINKLLEKCDIYFKRSYSSIYNCKLKNSEKIHSLGLNYMVTIPGNVAHYPMKYDSRMEKFKKIIRMLPFSEYYNGEYTVQAFEDIPKKEKEPKILFMARLWDVQGDYKGQISKFKMEERQYINHVRAECIRLCRKEFGHRFFGGVNLTSYALENFKDVVIEDKKITKRNIYLEKVKESSICISTMGLHKSIGWKFAEYIAASKAIVSEQLHYEVPGQFVEGENYLIFKTAEECVSQIYNLVENDDYRYRMMIKNYEYYNQNVRPDRLIFNSLLTVLNVEGGIQIEQDFNSVYSYL